MREFERWLEPQLADGADLSYLAGWANKLPGAIVRLAGILHVCGALSRGGAWQDPIDRPTVEAAVRIGRDYLLPHARAAFGLMGADTKAETARAVWHWIAAEAVRLSEYSEYSESAPPRFSRRAIHQGNRRRFKTVDELDPMLQMLVREGYLRPAGQVGAGPGRGKRSPDYEVNPLAVAAFRDATPRTHCTHCTH
jgi:hypothetical protein